MYKTMLSTFAAALLVPVAVNAADPAADAPMPAGALAQAPPEPGAPPKHEAPPEAAKAPPWYSAVTFSGFVDTFYQVRLDAAQDAPYTVGRSFDNVNGFNLGDAVLSASMPASPAGFRLDLQFGNTATVIDSAAAFSAGQAQPTFARYVLQAYAAFKLGPVELHAGRFVTAASAEVVPAKDNWLYSRSILYGLVPITHTGAHLLYPVTGELTLRVGISNGWDVVTSGYAGKTGEAQLAWAGPSSTTVALTTYFGPNPTVWSGAPNTTGEWRVLIDAVAGTTVGPLGLLANFDWATENSQDWWGGSLAARYSLPGDVVRVTVRGEYVKDSKGARFATGVDTNIYEGTLGLSVPVGSSSELRLEGRYDHASEPVFNKGAPTDNQVSATIAALAWF